MAPDRSRIVSESFALTFINCGPFCVDTLISPSSDLWLLNIP
jgi:hypothetical protein